MLREVQYYHRRQHLQAKAEAVTVYAGFMKRHSKVEAFGNDFETQELNPPVSGILEDPDG